ncbi:MAG: single-stranded DNA-binding protein [Candidatus Margulisbacteria bacterium]|nr:single-stranded DNA-binding protein [Candidatus Margulisiibacteriota bacterium]
MYNKVFLIGNLTRDPEMRFTTAGIPVTRFTIAVNRRFKSADNQEADFIRILTWRKLAEFAGEYLTKGKTVAVEGRLQVDSYEKEGKTRMTAEVLADNVQILSRKTTEAGDVAADNSPKESAGDDEIPF